MDTAQIAPPELDDEARRQFEEEARRHTDALSALRAGDADRMAEEFNRHLDRVREILDSLARRCVSVGTGDRVPNAPPVVAVVDDEEPARRSMERVLRAAGYGVATFASGADFLQPLSSKRPDCVLLDLQMPGMSGFDVLSHLARREQRVPAVVVTGLHAQETRRRVMGAGAAAYFTKPVDATALLEAITAAITGRAPG